MVRHIGFDPTASFDFKLPPDINSTMYLPFDSDLNDDSPNSLTATAFSGASVSTSVKKFGTGSLSLSPNQYIEFQSTTSGANRALFNLENADFTIEAWVYQTSANDNPIAGRDKTAGDRSYILKLDNNKITFLFSVDGSTIEQYSWHTGNVTSNNWHHVAVVRSGAQLSCFLDGVSDPSPTIIGSGIGTRTINFTSDVFMIGRSELSGGYFDGYIDDFRYFKYAALYNNNFSVPTTALGPTSPSLYTYGFRSTFSVDQMREGLEDESWPGPPTTSITIRAIGAGGAGDFPTGSRAGDGGYSSAELQVVPGTQLNIVVGRGGSNGGSTGTLTQGGGGGTSDVSSGGGGGFSGVFSGSSTPSLDNVLQANALVIAGGGGGGGYASVTSTGGAFGDTGEGGGLSGDNGTANGGSGPPYRWGYGGTQVAGGAGGSAPGASSSNIGQDGSALQGGDSNVSSQSGGGGGGGWFGGGGGGWKVSDGVGGGGGGSGYITPSATSGSITVLGGAGGTLPSSLAGNSYGLTSWYSANHGAVEIIDGNGSTVYTYTGTVQTHTVA